MQKSWILLNSAQVAGLLSIPLTDRKRPRSVCSPKRRKLMPGYVLGAVDGEHMFNSSGEVVIKVDPTRNSHDLSFDAAAASCRSMVFTNGKRPGPASSPTRSRSPTSA